MKKILATIILAICFAGLPATHVFDTTPTAFADDAADKAAADKAAAAIKKQTDALKNMQFDVTTHLKLTRPCDANNKCPDGVACEGPEGKKVCNIQNQSYFGGEGEGVTKYPVFRFILDIIETLTKIAGTIAVIMLILTGFMMMFSQGNQNTMEKAKQMFLYEIVGMVAILLSYVLITVVQSIFTL